MDAYGGMPLRREGSLEVEEVVGGDGGRSAAWGDGIGLAAMVCGGARGQTGGEGRSAVVDGVEEVVGGVGCEREMAKSLARTLALRIKASARVSRASSLRSRPPPPPPPPPLEIPPRVTPAASLPCSTRNFSGAS